MSLDRSVEYCFLEDSIFLLIFSLTELNKAHKYVFHTGTKNAIFSISLKYFWPILGNIVNAQRPLLVEYSGDHIVLELKFWSLYVLKYELQPFQPFSRHLSISQKHSWSQSNRIVGKVFACKSPTQVYSLSTQMILQVLPK